MKNLTLPKDYSPALGIIDMEIAIKTIKDSFERNLAQSLNLTRVSAPLFVASSSGLNDNLSGIERPVDFDVLDTNENMQIVHSLAKWKRLALKRYGFKEGCGLYTDMNAIRRDEELDNLHSVYVDQWDWEKIISMKNRNIDTLQETVKSIVFALWESANALFEQFPSITPIISKEVFFISSEELLQLYPSLSSKEREDAICKKHKTVFITHIGGKLSNGEAHDSRAPDYDDWDLNGDLLVWYPVLERSVELSSMGIRVDGLSLAKQLKISGCEDRRKLPFHEALLNGELPLTIGGGIGQSRICMILLRCAHIGEVHSSCWSKEMLDITAQNGINLL